VPRSTCKGPDALLRLLWLWHRTPLSIFAIFKANPTGTPCRLASDVTNRVASEACAKTLPAVIAAIKTRNLIKASKLP
jgi:hypothetical protein